MVKCKGCGKETGNDEIWCHDPNCYYVIANQEYKCSKNNHILGHDWLFDYRFKNPVCQQCGIVVTLNP